jgi:hypothetical protein
MNVKLSGRLLRNFMALLHFLPGGGVVLAVVFVVDTLTVSASFVLSLGFFLLSSLLLVDFDSLVLSLSSVPSSCQK